MAALGDAMDVDGEHNSLERRGRLEEVDKEREKPVAVSSEEESGSEDCGGLERPVVEIEESEDNSGSEGENDFEEEGGLEKCGERVIRNALLCLKKGLSAHDFVALNSLDHQRDGWEVAVKNNSA